MRKKWALIFRLLKLGNAKFRGAGGCLGVDPINSIYIYIFSQIFVYLFFIRSNARRQNYIGNKTFVDVITNFFPGNSCATDIIQRNLVPKIRFRVRLYIINKVLSLAQKWSFFLY